MIRKDEADIKSLIDLMENNWRNPLSPDESYLVNMSTGTVTPPEVQGSKITRRGRRGVSDV